MKFNPSSFGVTTQQAERYVEFLTGVIIGIVLTIGVTLLAVHRAFN